MATLLNTWYGPWAGPNSSNHHRVRIQLYKDSDTGSGYKMHWVWSVQVVRDTGSTYISASWTSSKYYASGTVNGYYLSTTGQQFTVAYGSSCTTTGSAQYYNPSAHKSTASASYTVPKPTYTISYNANGGTGAPGNQTKTYGTNITLSSTVPTRDNYNFLGWATSSTATTATYQPGATFSTNANTTLYAVWTLSYIYPSVTSMSVDRCLQDGTLDDEGTYCRTIVGYKADTTIDATNVISTVAVSVHGVTDTVTVNQQSGTVTVISTAQESTESSFEVEATVTDTYRGGTASMTRTLPAAHFVIDFAPPGDAIGMGKPASRPGYVSLGLQLALDNEDDPIVIDGREVTPQQAACMLLNPHASFTGASGTATGTAQEWRVTYFNTRMSGVTNDGAVTYDDYFTFSNGVITALKPCVLEVSGCMNWTDSVAGNRGFGVFMGSANIEHSAFQSFPNTVTSRKSVIFPPKLFLLSAGDQLTIKRYEQSGAVYVNGTNYSWVTIRVVNDRS